MTTSVLVVILISAVVLIAWLARSSVRTLRLRRELQRFRAMTEHNTDLISVVAPDGSLTYVTAASLHFLGEPPARVIGRQITEFVHGDDLALIGALWADVVSVPGKVLHTPEFRLVRPDGSIIHAESVGRNLIHDPAVGGVLVNTRDVTERHRAQERLRAAEERFRGAQKLEAVGRLAGGIAHDFNNLLTSIQGYTRLLLENDRLEESMRADLEQVQEEAARAATLTRQLLAFSRRQLVQPQVIELNRVVNGIRAMVQGLVGSTIAVQFDLSPDAGSVRADTGQLEQVIVNLVMNAVDVMPGGGSLEIATRNRTITREQAAAYPHEVEAGEYVELAVTDTGGGIPADVLPNIFEPFFTTKPAGRGTGLGLSTVYGIVKQSGGYVWAEPACNGTMFRVCLPGVAAAAPRATPTAAPAAAGGETILLVEDEQAVRRLTARILERAGYSVLSACDGAAAIELSAQHVGTIDLVLTDVVMPGLNGREVVERLRESRPGLRALFASGYTRDVIIEQGFVDPVIEFIEKPFAPDALVHRVKQVIAGAAAPSSP